MNDKKKNIIEKILFSIFFILYYNICFLIFAIEIYTILIYQIYLIIYFLFLFLDTMIRPISEKGEKSDKYAKFILVLFILGPFFLISSYLENKYLIIKYIPIWNNIIISYLGILIYIVAGIILIGSRIQLGKFATGVLLIEDDHKLIKQGIYKYIRHPIYSGSIIGVLGFGLVFRALIVLIFCLVLYFIIFRQRMIYEEQILEDKFGQEYVTYKKKTKRLIPFIY